MAGSLEMRVLGGTGLKVSCLGFGASPLGNVYQKVTEEDSIACVNEAVRLGINFFDTSPFYGDTASETMLGKTLKTLPVPRDQYVVSTKCGRYAGGFDFSADRVTASVDESLQRLQLDYVDIIQCHDIEFGSLNQVISETIPALQKLKEVGKVRHIGITGLPLKIFNYVLDRVPPGAVDVVLSYCHHSLNDTTLIESLPYLKSHGVGVISASPLSMGLFTPQGPPDWHPATKEIKDACSAAVAHSQSNGEDITKLALQYSLRNPDIATTLVGMCSVDQVRSNVVAAIQSLDGNGPDPKLLAEIESILQPVKNKTWPSGREENNL